MGRHARIIALTGVLALAACTGIGTDDEGQAGDPAQTQTQAPGATSAAPMPTEGAGDEESEGTAGGDPGGDADDAATGSASPGDGGAHGDGADVTTDGQAELPRGGRELFPDYALVGYVGHPDSEAMGRLGIGDPDERAGEIETELADFAGDRELMPVLELVVSVAHPVPGADGTYRTQMADDTIEDFLELARRHDALLLLNIQTGAVPFPEEVRDFEQWLVQPDVGVALDPEWAVAPGQVPGQVYGRTTGAELDEVAAYLAGLVEEHDLPEKAMVYHQVHASVVQDEAGLTEHEGVAAIKSVDGIGHPLDKVYTYDLVNASTPEHVHGGFKIFLEEDAEYGPLMTPEEVAELDPEVEYLMVE